MPRRSIWELKSFRWVFIISLFLIILLANKILEVNFGGYSISFEAKAIGNFIDAMRLPLGILSGMIIVLGFIATIHRSKQAAENIKQSQSQNNFANYYKHQEIFVNKYEKGIISIGYDTTIEINEAEVLKVNFKCCDSLKIYKLIYTKNNIISGVVNFDKFEDSPFFINIKNY